MSNLPQGFSYLQDKRIICDLSYLGNNNFIGRPIKGYRRNVCIATNILCSQLSQVQDDLDQFRQNFKLKVFDAYRPQTAVDDFIAWSNNTDTKMKGEYYPNLSKHDLFAHEYLMSRSTHSRGGAVDLTIVQELKDEYIELDMGTIFDFFGEESHTDFIHLTKTAKDNRQLLRSVMERNGFKNYYKEWWHYNVVDELYPETYFDFEIN